MSPLPSFDPTFHLSPTDEPQLDLFPGWQPALRPQGGALAPDSVVAEHVRGELLSLVNPLATVVGFADLLLEAGRLQEADARRVRFIHDAGREMERRLRRVMAGLGDAREPAAIGTAPSVGAMSGEPSRWESADANDPVRRTASWKRSSG